MKRRMSPPIRKALVRAAENGMNIMEVGVYFCTHKQYITYSEYLAFCDWAKKKESFYYWMIDRLYSKDR